MGSKDLKEMNAGIMDPEGRGITTAGKICGMISCIIIIVTIVVVIPIYVLAHYNLSREPPHHKGPGSVGYEEPGKPGE